MTEFKMTVTKDTDSNDVFKLLSEPAITIPLTEDGGITAIKEMFSFLLEELTKDDVKVVFEKTPGYTAKLYENVCEEYVVDLSSELENARLCLKEKGLIIEPESKKEEKEKSNENLNDSQ